MIFSEKTFSVVFFSRKETERFLRFVSFLFLWKNGVQNGLDIFVEKQNVVCIDVDFLTVDFLYNRYNRKNASCLDKQGV